MNILVIIPARGGSKGIPRKNLRSMCGKPLLFYSINTALASTFAPDVYVSTEDSEIAAIAGKLGAKVIVRDQQKALDHTTLDPVIHDAYLQATEREGKQYDLVVTLQPTSPLLKSKSLDRAIELLISNASIDTVISAKDDTHLTWKMKEDKFVPNYKARVNRQYLEPIYRETGGFLITRSRCVSENNRIGPMVHLHLLNGGEEIDIDTYEDWSLCEYYLRRKNILFVVSGYKAIGLGHVYNSLLVANDILNHHVEFIVDDKSRLGFDKISSKNYTVTMQHSDSLLDDIVSLNPDVVINDCLDTTEDYIRALNGNGIKVINFEDLGSGASHADLVVNAIYPEREVLPKHYFGHDYFILRDEFLLTSPRATAKSVANVLVTFGGVDPNNYTQKVIAAIEQYCVDQGIVVSVVVGFGYDNYESLKPFQHICLHRNCTNIAEHMSAADIVFTSAGRTTYEVASLQVPTIVLAQNERELTHLFASAEFGFNNLGLGTQVAPEEILRAFVGLVESNSVREHMSSLMARVDLFRGRSRVLKLINEVVESI